jgi:serine/threonine protein kinase/curved DNA-binding protein CbpA
MKSSTTDQSGRVSTGDCSNTRCSRPKPGEAGRCLNCQALLVGVLVRHRYRVHQTVGKGGFGITYLVDDQDCFNEERILKELCPKPSSGDNTADDEDLNVTAERLFKREAKVLLNLQHSGIPKLYAYFIDKDYSYLVQDFIPGQTLSEELEERSRVFNEQEAVDMLNEITDILEYLHTRTPPIVHRDIKPQNLMRHSSGKLLLIDFGAVCQAASNAGSSQTLIGSPGYAPPEQIFGRPVPQSDLYAAGATVLRLITGVPPSQLFNNKTQRMEWESRAKVSTQFAALINALLVQDVKKRLISAAELKRRLQSLNTDPVAQVRSSGSRIPIVSVPQSASSKATPDAPITRIYLDASQQMENLDYIKSTSADETGDLKEKPLIFLMRRFYNQKMTGLFTCINETGTKSIHFDQGTIVFASSTVEAERLGEMLIRSGRISLDDFDRASRIMKVRSVRLGSALIEIGQITPDELKSLIVMQVSNIIYSIFDWTAGQYEVRLKFISEEPIKISLSTADIIFEGLRRMENIDLVKNWLGDFTRKLTTTTDPLLLYQTVNLKPQEAFIVSRIDSIMSIEEILSLGGLPEAETLKTLCGLLAVGILEWVDADSKLSRPAVVVANILTGPQPLPSNFDIQTAAAFCYEVENTLRSIDSNNHYAVLGIERGASDEEIREAYSQMAKKFHPDRHAQLANYRSLRAELEKIFNRISEAFRVLSDSSARSEHDHELRSTGKTRIPRLSDQQRKSSEKENHEAQPKRGQEWPNVSPNPAPSLPRAQRAPTPQPTQQRPDDGGKNQHQGIALSGQPMFTDLHINNRDVRVTAQNWFQKGIEYYNLQQFAPACRAFQAAAIAAPNVPEYRIYLARSLTMMKSYSTEAEQEFYKAIELDPRNVDYYIEFGIFYQKINMDRQADEMFEKALEIQPDNPVALRAKRPR